jgi:HAD superfamily hydrolase (TIGR01509 family)
MPFDLVIFDCDGVLVDSERLSVAVEARVLTELGWPHTAADVVRRWMGRTSTAQLTEIADRLGAELADEYDSRSTAEVHRAFEAELLPVTGIETLLDRLDECQVRTCVASSGTHERIRRTLGLTGLYARFEGRIFSATDVEHGKPAPDLFLHAAARMGADPGRCVVVEDSVYGVRAAVAADMTVYGFAGGLTDATELAEAGAVVFEQMADLADVLVGPDSSTA